MTQSNFKPFDHLQQIYPGFLCSIHKQYLFINFTIFMSVKIFQEITLSGLVLLGTVDGINFRMVPMSCNPHRKDVYRGKVVCWGLS